MYRNFLQRRENLVRERLVLRPIKQRDIDVYLKWLESRYDMEAKRMTYLANFEKEHNPYAGVIKKPEKTGV